MINNNSITYDINNYEYINIQYNLETTSKPYPIIRFILLKNDTTYEKFVHKITISKCDFDSISKIVDVKDVLSKTNNLTPPLEITIISKKGKKVILLRGKEIINSVFQQIEFYFKEKSQEEIVRYSLTNLLIRLGIADMNNIDKSYFKLGRRQKS